MFEIGASLRHAREQQGLTLAEIERTTRIRERYLAALENERFQVLPGDTYAKGFVRQYAEALGLDGNLYVRELEEQLAAREPPPPPPEPRGRNLLRGPVVGAFVAVAAAVAIVAGIAAWKLTGSESPPAVKHRRAAPQAAAVARPAHVERRKAHAHKAKKHEAPPHLVLTATGGDCWILVRDGSAGGAILYEGTVHPGIVLRFKKVPLWIRAGAPWNLTARLGGKLLHGLPPQTGNFVVTRRGLELA